MKKIVYVWPLTHDMEASRLIQNKQTPASMGVGGWVSAEGGEGAVVIAETQEPVFVVSFPPMAVWRFIAC